ncbi:hypothetical protein BKA63DRAFT_14704 [Paraphoma chrysanthemicola]|nr:hypothetical protein BKA63DRAFT_14704 [Paraphoma chrysanthemicola]
MYTFSRMGRTSTVSRPRTVNHIALRNPPSLSEPLRHSVHLPTLDKAPKGCAATKLRQAQRSLGFRQANEPHPSPVQPKACTSRNIRLFVLVLATHTALDFWPIMRSILLGWTVMAPNFSCFNPAHRLLTRHTDVEALACDMYFQQKLRVFVMLLGIMRM